MFFISFVLELKAAEMSDRRMRKSFLFRTGWSPFLIACRLLGVADISLSDCIQI